MRTGEILQPLLVLKPSPLKWIAVLLLSFVFVAGGVMMVEDGDEVAAGWFCAVFFGLCVLVALVQLLSSANHTIVTKEGLHVGTMFKRFTIRWEELDRFGIAEWSQWHGPFRQKHRLVGIDFKEGSDAFNRIRRGAWLSTAIVGFHGALPDNYGYKHKELADLLNEYLHAYRKALHE